MLCIHLEFSAGFDQGTPKRATESIFLWFTNSDPKVLLSQRSGPVYIQTIKATRFPSSSRNL